MDLSMFALTDKVAIVTGAGRGIGRAIALGFAQAGADVVVADITAADGKDTAAKVEAEGGKALAIPTDVRNVDQVTNMLQKTLDLFGRVDILVNNAGGLSRGQFSDISSHIFDMSAHAWEAVINENLNNNLTSTFICSKIVGEVMARQKTGNIINMGSIAGLGPYPSAAHYGAAKAGIISLTKSLAVEFAPYNIRVNAIAPGLTKTPATAHVWQDNKYSQGWLKNIPLGRLGRPEDITGAAIYLASDASAYVTGETIVVNGGLTTAVLD